jgi:crotonobetainyl-CoA:carnitine CoA-transferase CaiB-like acyl-CoA transferase
LLTYAASFFLNAGVVLGPQGSTHAHAMPYQSFETADGALAVAVFTEAFWPGFCRALDAHEWIADERFATAAARRAHGSVLEPVLTARLRARPRSEWLERFRAHGVPAEAVQRVDEVFADPQIVARNLIVQTRDVAAGVVRTVGSPLACGEPFAPRPAPRLGEHTDEVLREIAGFDAARIAALRAARVIA